MKIGRSTGTPTKAQQARLFRETFGRDDVLLAYQNDLLNEGIK